MLAHTNATQQFTGHFCEWAHAIEVDSTNLRKAMERPPPPLRGVAAEGASELLLRMVPSQGSFPLSYRISSLISYPTMQPSIQ
jgi:hypothetical protein